MSKTTIFKAADAVLTKEPDLHYISGAFIWQNKKYDGNRLVIRLVKKYSKLLDIITTPKTMQEFANQLMILSQDIDNHKIRWPLSSIAQEALKSNKKIDRNLVSLTDAQLVLIAQILYHPYDLQKFIIISGKAGTGKSTFANIISQLLDNDVSTIENTSGDNYDLNDILSTRFAWADDMVGKLPLEEGRLKSIVTHNACKVNPKFVSKYTITNPQTIICFLANKDPHVDISDPGILRRIVWYSMNNKIQNPDPRFGTEDYDHDWLLTVAILAKNFDNPDWFDMYFKQDTFRHLVNCNSVWKYIDSVLIPTYGAYCDYMAKAGNTNIYSADSFALLYDAYYDYSGKQAPDVCDADLDL